ncbi:putative pentatricopeptide repeat-containing protein [Acorus calamus]|uniref:Pentatricopeptide repeat-containing protein n=1 Tax=Acorus calamus TaxID=4465 RepID=A0AAV9DKZ1_ACOCL|nr:putative pentatricopeptide repeat-containing protein [Acorus calamus]
MKEPQPFDETTTPRFDRLIETLDTNPPIKTLRNLHTHLILRSLAADPPTSIKLMRAYAARGDTVTVRSLFDGMPRKNVVFFNVLIRSYVNNGLYREALLAFRDMSAHRVTPDNYTLPCALKACSCGGEGCLGVGRQIHAAALKPGLDANLYVGNALITMYFKCARSSADARRVFSSMACDVVSWNALIAGLAQNRESVEAVTALKEMVGAARRVEPDGVLWQASCPR